MSVFIARQPILDAQLNIRGYELFYRNGFTNHYTGVNADEASSKVIMDTFYNLGLSNLTDDKPASIFPQSCCKKRWPPYFPLRIWLLKSWKRYRLIGK